MSFQIETGCPRAPAGLRDKGFRVYIPRLFENGDYILPTRNATILAGCLRYKTSTFTERGKSKLVKRLMTSFGFSKGLALVFAMRKVSEIRRIEQTVHGIIDSLLLFDRSMFVTENGLSLLKHIVRKVLSTGVFDIPETVRMWKEYLNHLLIHSSESETLEKPKKSVKNFFFSLDAWPKIRDIRAGITDKANLESLAHLTSSRQLPTGNKKTERIALEKFRSTVTEKYLPDNRIIEELYEASIIIGRRCRKAGPGPVRSSHISLATAGSLFNKVKEGGRAEEILQHVQETLSFIPEVEREFKLPFTTVNDIPGIPRWQTWCRNESLGNLVPEGERELPFGSLSRETLAGFNPYRIGFDEAIGSQILVCAYLAMQEDTHSVSEIPIRVLTVTEPGCKARIVTTGPWWLYVLQQAIAHVTRAFLASHPSAESGLGRSDQAWQYLSLICNARKDFKEDFACLSSDLSEATDTIPKIVCTNLLKGFKEGLGYSSALFDTCIDLIEMDRMCLVAQTDSVFVATRGVFMGEPLAKTVLTLLNLSCEEVAIRKFLQYDFKHPVQVGWRCFQVSGDDHIAVGPRGYLREITETHIRAGSKISPDKHAISTKFVKFCEKILDVRNFSNIQWHPKTINNSYEEYHKSPFVDSIKIRLLSPCSKNNDNFNERNVSVGKAKSLGQTLRWMTPVHFEPKWKRMVRDRFFQRMGALLPDSSSGVYWHLLLPTELGGLDLWMEQDIPDLLIKLPSPSKTVIEDFISGSLNREIKKLVKAFCSNSSYRGYTLNETETTLVEEFIIDPLFDMLLKVTPKEAIAQFNLQDLTMHQALRRLKNEGYLNEQEIRDSLLRPFLFKEILSREAKPSAFNTESFKHRYAKLWDLVFCGDTILTEEQLRKALSLKQDNYLYYIGDKLEVPIRGSYRSVNLLEEATAGLPDLKIHWIDVGILQ